MSNILYYNIYFHFFFTVPICNVCKKATNNAHSCFLCNKPVHAICGRHPDGIEEGYGAPVTCQVCLDDLELTSSAG